MGDRGLPGRVRALEAALIAAGERVIRVPGRDDQPDPEGLTAAGKSDPIDARAVALAVVRTGSRASRRRSPTARDGDPRVWDYEIRSSASDPDDQPAARHLVTIAPELEAQLGPAALRGPRLRWLTRQLARLPVPPQLRVAKRLLKRIAEIAAKNVSCSPS